MYANVPSPSCSSVASPAAVREAVAVRLGQRAEGQGQRGISGHVVDALALLLCWSFSVGRCLKDVDVLRFVSVSEAKYPQRDRVAS